MNTCSKFSISHRLSAHLEDNITLDPSVYFEVTLCLFILPTFGAIVFVGTVLFAWACLPFMGFELHTLAKWFLRPHSVPIADHDCCHVFQLPRFPHWCFCLSPCSLCLSFSMAFTWTSSVVGLAVLPAVTHSLTALWLLFALRMYNAFCRVKSGSLSHVLCVWLSMMTHMMQSLMWLSVSICWTDTISP